MRGCGGGDGEGVWWGEEEEGRQGKGNLMRGKTCVRRE